MSDRITNAIDVAARDGITSKGQRPREEGCGGDTHLSIADLYAQPPLMPLWPTFGRDICLLAESTTYQLASQGRLPVPTVRLGRKLYVRTRDVLAFCGLPAHPENDSAAGGNPTAPIEHTTPTSE